MSHGEHEQFRNAYLGDLIDKRIARRSFLKTTAAGAGAAALPAVLAPQHAEAQSADPGAALTFTPIAPSGLDAVIVPERYAHNVVIRWGDPILPGAPAFALGAQTPASQAGQFGFNCDFVAHYPLPPWLELEVERLGKPSALSAWWLGVQLRSLSHKTLERGLLWVNHEYTSGVDMFEGYTSASPTADQVDIELAAHAGSVVAVQRDKQGKWSYDASSVFNRRITGTTPIALTGPAAGHALLQTSADPSGRSVLGMLNNCGGGVTPWGTVLSAEENFDQYFANAGQLSAEKAALYARLPAPSAASERKWERFHPRFDLAQEPNEYARFGYVVEIDPYDPTSTPRKHTALGRFKHEAAVPVIANNGQVAIYSGDDQRFEHMYKFVTDGTYAAHDRSANMRLLESGTLYVAKLFEDGTGQWLPLVYGEGALTEENGFASQADVIVDTRRAATLLGATRMDRPEDIEVSPVTKKVYVALTNNSARTSVATDPGEVAANPRLGNRWGHVLELEEDGGDNTALSFTWDLFLVCGDPASTPDVYFAGFDPALVSPISCPDNLELDAHGNLWIATDGAPASPGFASYNDGIFAVPTEGADRGYLRQFLSGVAGSEIASLKLTGDGRSLFASIQHPGEGRGLPNTQSAWPDGTNLPPRPAVVGVFHTQNNKKIGS